MINHMAIFEVRTDVELVSLVKGGSRHVPRY